MNVSSLQTSRRRTRRNARCRSAAAIAALAVALLAGCGGGGGGSTTTTQLATPTFGVLEIPDPSVSSGWSTFTTNLPPPEVLPVRGRAVRLYYYAPGGSVFSVSLRELAIPATPTMPATPSVTTPLAENTGTVAPPGDGYFQVLSENPNGSQAIYHMYVRAPASLMANPANYDILVVNKSQSVNTTDSTPMVVPLRARKVFTVTVAVTGDGKVTSSPGGITCGTAPITGPLTACSFDFGPGQVNLAAQGNDPNNITFSGWTGNCAGMGQTCPLTLDGTGRMVANAFFGGGSPSGASSAAAPAVQGWRWIGIPGCSSPGHPLNSTVQSDALGYFCCAPGGAPDPRCHGEQFSPADCTNQPNMGLNARLIQPGGCYEVDSFP